MNTYTWVIWDTHNEQIVSTHRGRSSWASKGHATLAYRNYREHDKLFDLRASYPRYKIRKAVIAVLP